jgi:hypothetical protein
VAADRLRYPSRGDLDNKLFDPNAFLLHADANASFVKFIKILLEHYVLPHNLVDYHAKRHNRPVEYSDRSNEYPDRSNEYPDRSNEYPNGSDEYSDGSRECPDELDECPRDFDE